MEINIAVIGRPGVGKSTLIQRAFSRRTLPTTVPSSIRVTVDHVAYTVNLIELDLEAFDIPQTGRVQFPKQVDGLYTLPRIDGSMVLYDVMNTSSTVEVPQLLSMLTYVGSLCETNAIRWTRQRLYSYDSRLLQMRQSNTYPSS
jgi:GTPase SAR1 family protein